MKELDVREVVVDAGDRVAREEGAVALRAAPAGAEGAGARASV